MGVNILNAVWRNIKTLIIKKNDDLNQAFRVSLKTKNKKENGKLIISCFFNWRKSCTIIPS